MTLRIIKIRILKIVSNIMLRRACKISKNFAMKEKMFYWSPRVLAILAILFLMLFSLDCFEAGQGLGRQLTCFLMHNIPAYIVIAVLVISWKWEFPGGLLFIAAAIGGSIFFHGFSGNWGVNIIMAPFLITGILFILHFYIYGRQVTAEGSEHM